MRIRQLFSSIIGCCRNYNQAEDKRKVRPEQKMKHLKRHIRVVILNSLIRIVQCIEFHTIDRSQEHKDALQFAECNTVSNSRLSLITGTNL